MAKSGQDVGWGHWEWRLHDSHGMGEGPTQHVVFMPIAHVSLPLPVVTTETGKLKLERQKKM